MKITSCIPGELDLGSPLAAGLLSTGGGEAYLPRGDAARLTASSRARFSSSSLLLSSSRRRSSSLLFRSFFSCNACKLNYGTSSMNLVLAICPQASKRLSFHVYIKQCTLFTEVTLPCDICAYHGPSVYSADSRFHLTPSRGIYRIRVRPACLVWTVPWHLYNTRPYKSSGCTRNYSYCRKHTYCSFLGPILNVKLTCIIFEKGSLEHIFDKQ